MMCASASAPISLSMELFVTHSHQLGARGVIPSHSLKPMCVCVCVCVCGPQHRCLPLPPVFSVLGPLLSLSLFLSFSLSLFFSLSPDPDSNRGFSSRHDRHGHWEEIHVQGGRLRVPFPLGHGGWAGQFSGDECQRATDRTQLTRPVD